MALRTLDPPLDLPRTSAATALGTLEGIWWHAMVQQTDSALEWTIVALYVCTGIGSGPPRCDTFGTGSGLPLLPSSCARLHVGRFSHCAACAVYEMTCSVGWHVCCLVRLCCVSLFVAIHQCTDHGTKLYPLLVQCIWLHQIQQGCEGRDRFLVPGVR